MQLHVTTTVLLKWFPSRHGQKYSWSVYHQQQIPYPEVSNHSRHELSWWDCMRRGWHKPDKLQTKASQNIPLQEGRLGGTLQPYDQVLRLLFLDVSNNDPNLSVNQLWDSFEAELNIGVFASSFQRKLLRGEMASLMWTARLSTLWRGGTNYMPRKTQAFKKLRT